MISEGLMQNLSVKGLCDDSRRAKPGDLFFSLSTEGFEEFARTADGLGRTEIRDSAKREVVVLN